MRLFLLAAAAWLCLPTLTIAETDSDSGLRRLNTGVDSAGWEAVGRLDLGGVGFCTGALISPTLVLTAAHCMFDPKSGELLDAGSVEFLAGWSRENKASFVVKGKKDPFVKIVLRNRATNDSHNTDRINTAFAKR